jgi:hypothetical protein
MVTNFCTDVEKYYKDLNVYDNAQVSALECSLLPSEPEKFNRYCLTPSDNKGFTNTCTSQGDVTNDDVDQMFNIARFKTWSEWPNQIVPGVPVNIDRLAENSSLNIQIKSNFTNMTVIVKRSQFIQSTMMYTTLPGNADVSEMSEFPDSVNALNVATVEVYSSGKVYILVNHDINPGYEQRIYTWELGDSTPNLIVNLGNNSGYGTNMSLAGDSLAVAITGTCVYYIPDIVNNPNTVKKLENVGDTGSPIEPILTSFNITISLDINGNLFIFGKPSISIPIPGPTPTWTLTEIHVDTDTWTQRGTLSTAISYTMSRMKDGTCFIYSNTQNTIPHVTAGNSLVLPGFDIGDGRGVLGIDKPDADGNMLVQVTGGDFSIVKRLASGQILELLSVQTHLSQDQTLPYQFTVADDYSKLFFLDGEGVKYWRPDGKNDLMNVMHDGGRNVLMLDNGVLVSDSYIVPSSDQKRSTTVLLQEGGYGTLTPSNSKVVSKNGKYIFDTNDEFVRQNLANSIGYAISCRDPESRKKACQDSYSGTYCNSNADADPRCICFNNEELLARMFNVELLKQNPAQYNQLLVIAPCLSPECIQTRSENNIASVYMQDQECPTSINICTNILNLGNDAKIDGNVVVSNNCGSFGSNKIPCSSTCPIGTTCSDNTGFCQTACSKDENCDINFQFCDLGNAAGGVCENLRNTDINVDTSSSGLSGLAIGLIVSAAVLVVTVAILLWYFLVYKKKKMNTTTPKTTTKVGS